MKSPNKLYKNALSYRDLGWSVIPTWGDCSPDKFKAAAVRWSAFQQRRATPNEIHHWFMERQFAGVAIVCGSISQLAVLDFDDERLASLFVQLNPDLADTHQVRSGGRGLPHLYYHVPAHLQTRSRHAPGVDWQYNGAYVIAPPTTQGDAMWTVACDVAPKILTEADLSRIMTFLDSIPADKPQPPVNRISVPNNPISEPVDGLSLEITTQYYRDRVHLGRNNALFQTCLWIRRQSGTQRDAMLLANVHAYQPAAHQHIDESPGKRRVEAVKTIVSAFSRPLSISKERRLQTVPNLLRERLLRNKQTALVRVLEAMVQEQWQLGRIFSRSDVSRIAQKYSIGDWSVRKALITAGPDQNPIFAQVANPAIAAAGDGDKSPELNAIELRVSAPTKNQTPQRGRPSIRYVMPSMQALCTRYGITFLAGDALDKDALASVRRYRVALHKALLARRPGTYHRQWLARRLGVSIRTLCRYNAQNEIRITPQYIDKPLIWQNVNAVVPADLDSPLMSQFGAFLEDDQGKRYPPFRKIAHRLLSQKRRVMYRRRTLNQYSLVMTMPMANTAKNTTISEGVPQQALSIKTDRESSQKPEKPTLSFRLKQSKQKAEHRLSPMQIAAVDDLIVTLDGKLSRKRAEQLVERYGRFAVQDVLQTMKSRQRVSNPAGFVVQLLADRYGDRDAVSSAAEGLFLALHTPEGRPLVSWKKAQEIVERYGSQRISDVLREMHQRDRILNPVGYLVASLKRGQSATHRSNGSPAEIASQLVQAIRKRCPDRAMSHKRAKALVQQYGVKAVGRTLAIVKSRESIDNPAGFVISVLKSEAKTRAKASYR